MTKYEYLASLERAMRSLPEKERRDILYDYEEHFRMGADAGQTDDEICSRLGDPERVAAEYFSGGGKDQDGRVTSDYSYAGSVSNIFVSADAAAVDISTSADAENIGYRLNYKLNGDPAKSPRLELTEQGENIYINLYYADKSLPVVHVSNVLVKIIIPQSYAGRLYVKSNAGKVDVYGESRYELFSVRSNACRIRASGLSGNMECSISSGTAELEYSHFAGCANIRAEAASVTLRLPQDTGARVNYAGEFSYYKNYFAVPPSGDIGSGAPGIVNIGGSLARFVIAKR